MCLFFQAAGRSKPQAAMGCGARSFMNTMAQNQPKGESSEDDKPFSPPSLSLCSALLDRFLKVGFALMDKGLVPDFLIRFASRLLLGQTLAGHRKGGSEAQADALNAMVKQLKLLPIAIKTADANEQHYEVPTEYFLRCLGPSLKYSCCLYEDLKRDTLGEAEERMLSLYCDRADLADLKPGSTVLDLGCGWGSLSLYLAKRYPQHNFVSLSNSKTQREFIEGRAEERNLGNLRVHTGDIAEFDGFGEGTFHRILSIEMFEHMKNYELLLEKLYRWLKPKGKLFVHIFTHMRHTYHYEVQSESDWMTKVGTISLSLPFSLTHSFSVRDWAC